MPFALWEPEMPRAGIRPRAKEQTEKAQRPTRADQTLQTVFERVGWGGAR